MKKLRFHIVGLTHNDVKGREVEYAREAVGRTICLVPDDANPFDMLAVKAYDKQLFIGYVSALEGEDVRTLIIARKDRNLRTRCVGSNSKEGGDEKSGLQLIVEARVDVSDQEVELARKGLYEDSIYDDWHYTGPILPIDKLTRFSDCTMMLEGVINDIILIQEKLSHIRNLSPVGNLTPAGNLSHHPNLSEGAQNLSEGAPNLSDPDYKAELEEELRDNLEEARERLACFLEIQRSDYSREMTQTRNRILNKLYLIDDEEIHRMAEVLTTELGFITSSAYRERAAQSFFVDAPIALKQKQTGAYDYKDQLDAIEKQLYAFPYSLYPTFKADPVDFLRQVFYKRVPRKMMLQLLSGIVLMIMNGRVSDVKQWGKHGNEEALLAMKSVGAKLSGSERKKKLWGLVDEAILGMASYHKPSTGKLLLKSQSDWYPVFRMLNDWGIFNSTSQTDFCDYLEKRYEELDKGRDELAPCCKRKDLTQAAAPMFERHDALEWGRLHPKKWNVRSDKFNHYCDIVDAFKKLMQEQALLEHLILEDLLPSKKDEEDDEDTEDEDWFDKD
jgi:hypothetical protein